MHTIVIAWRLTCVVYKHARIVPAMRLFKTMRKHTRQCALTKERSQYELSWQCVFSKNAENTKQCALTKERSHYNRWNMTLHAKQQLLLHISVSISVGSPGDRIFANVDLLHVSSLLHHNVRVMPQQCLARVSALAHT